MGERKTLSIKAEQQREPEVVRADIGKVEAMLRVRRNRQGLGENVAQLEARLAELQTELAKASGE